MSNNAFVITGVTKEEYIKWCKENKKPSYKTETKKEFFSKIQQGKLIKDSKGNLIKKEK